MQHYKLSEFTTPRVIRSWDYWMNTNVAVIGYIGITQEIIDGAVEISHCYEDGSVRIDRAELSPEEIRARYNKIIVIHTYMLNGYLQEDIKVYDI